MCPLTRHLGRGRDLLGLIGLASQLFQRPLQLSHSRLSALQLLAYGCCFAPISIELSQLLLELDAHRLLGVGPLFGRATSGLPLAQQGLQPRRL